MGGLINIGGLVDIVEFNLSRVTLSVIPDEYIVC